METLQAFLEKNALTQFTPISSQSLHEFFERNYLSLNDAFVKGMIGEALKSDNSIKREEWESIFESFKQVKLERSEQASRNIQTMLGFANDETPGNIIRFLKQLHQNSHYLHRHQTVPLQIACQH